MKKIAVLSLASLFLITAGFVGHTKAATVGDIQVVYFAPNSFGVNPNLDAPAFVFENTSSFDITNGVFTISVGGDNAIADSFNVGTITAGNYVVVIPGLSNDGGAGHTFFDFTGVERDTSDVGPNQDTVPFSFAGIWNGLSVSTGIFTPAATRTAAHDAGESINFLGNDDPPCFNCFGPTIVATINTSAAAVPDQGSTLSLLAISIAFIGVASLRRKLAKA